MGVCGCVTYVCVCVCVCRVQASLDLGTELWRSSEALAGGDVGVCYAEQQQLLEAALSVVASNTGFATLEARARSLITYARSLIPFDARSLSQSMHPPPYSL